MKKIVVLGDGDIARKTIEIIKRDNLLKKIIIKIMI